MNQKWINSWAIIKKLSILLIILLIISLGLELLTTKIQTSYRQHQELLAKEDQELAERLAELRRRNLQLLDEVCELLKEHGHTCNFRTSKNY